MNTKDPEILEIFKGGSLSSTMLIKHPKFEKCILKKVSHELNREYGFVRFSSQIKRHLQLKKKEPNLFPTILETGIDIENHEAYCIYEYKENFISLFDFLYKKKLTQEIVIKVAKNLLDNIKILHSSKSKFPLPEGSLNYYVKEEMIRPLKQYEHYLNLDNIFFENKKVNKPKQTICLINKIIREIGNKFDNQSCLIHGNLTLENILINPLTFEISMIDVYDETYFDIPLSDYSQIFQCSKYFYGIRMRDQSSHSNETNFELMEANKNFETFNNEFEKHLLKKSESNFLLNLLIASQFIRLLPFRIKSNDTSNAIYFYSLASWILNQSINE